jgi:hypothetical protein
MRRDIPRLRSFGSHCRRSGSGGPGIPPPFSRRSRVGVGTSRFPPLAVTNAVLVLARSIGDRSVDEHSDLAARVHHILTDCLLALKRVDDVIKTARAVDLLISLFTLAVIINIVVVMPSTEAFSDLGEKAVEDLVCECFDHVGLVMRASDPSLHSDRLRVVFGTVSADHSVVYSSYVIRTVALNVTDRGILIGRTIWLPTEVGTYMTILTGRVRILEQTLIRAV